MFTLQDVDKDINSKCYNDEESYLESEKSNYIIRFIPFWKRSKSIRFK